MVLLHGFIKKSQQTPDQELDLAVKRKKEIENDGKTEGISKSEIAKRMNTSRSQLERLLDPDNPNVLLETVQKAAAAVGKRMTISLVDAPAS
jgi:transcriptional regulator with XRE-family HTH domain